jgi:hypothetical protein
MKRGQSFYDKINQAGYENFEGVTMDKYDPDMYDPDYADAPGAGGRTTKVNNATPGQKLNINLTIDNATASKITVELFSALNNWMTSLKADLVVAAHTMIPALSTEGLGTVGVGTVGYDQAGNAVVYGAAMAPSLTIGCGEYPYNSLVASTMILPFRNVFMRIAVETNAQLNNQVYHFTRTFAGGYQQNQVNVRSYKRPTQFQNLEVDVDAPFVIDAEKGLRYALEIGEVVQISMFINRWSKPALS